jgi:hypothetical protein
MGDDGDDTSAHQITWTSQLEKIISNEGERALCYSWLHNHAQKRYAKLDTYIALPVIVLSTLAGTGSIASESLFPGFPQAGIVIGGVSLGVGILNTISNYFGWAKRSEAHKIAGSTYSKIYRFIMIELSLPRGERVNPKDLMKMVREDMNRLQETSPQIPDESIRAFNQRFEDTTPEVSKPEITNGLDPIIPYEQAFPMGSPKPPQPPVSDDHVIFIGPRTVST